MKKFIILALVLFIAVMGLTIKYFSELQPNKQNIEKVMSMVPKDAALIFEFNNDQSFDDIFKNNELFPSILGAEKTKDLTYLRDHILRNESLKAFFYDHRLLISIHPNQEAKDIEFLISTSSSEHIQPEILSKSLLQQIPGSKIQSLDFKHKRGLKIMLPEIGKTFFLLVDGRSLSGSFSLELVSESAKQADEPLKEIFTRLSDQQISSSVANLYVNYHTLPTLINQLFKTRRSDVFGFLNNLPGTASLSLNYKTDAIMFNGFSNLDTSFNQQYFKLFLQQKPYKNTLKSIFPYTTAYSMSFAIAEPEKFGKDLQLLQNQNGEQKQRNALFEQIKKSTGVDIQSTFPPLLDHEFCVLTTDRLEKIAIIKLKDGSVLEPYFINISKEISEHIAQLNYESIPYFLLGNVFTIFKKPYFSIIDNYLILANSSATLNNYLRIYQNREFLSTNQEFLDFDALRAEQSNIAFFIHFSNAKPILKTTLKPAFASVFDGKDSGWSNYYGASYQFTSSDHTFYTNLYLKLKEKKTD